MSSKRLFLILSVSLLILGVGGGACVVYGSSFLEDKAQQLTALKLESLALQEQQRTLVQAKKDVQSFSELESIAKTVVPQEKDQARTVRELVALAGAAGVDIANISFPSSTLGEKKKSVSGTPGESSPTLSSNSSSSTSQIEPVDGIASLYQMDINVQGAGTPVSYQSFIDFLARLEQNRRTAQVINLTVQPSSTDRNQVTFSLILRVYIKP